MTSSKSEPKLNPDQLKSEAISWILKGRASKALELFERAYSLAPDRLDIGYRLGLARIDQAQVDLGIEILVNTLEKDTERKFLQSDLLDPIDDILTRRPTFKNLVKIKKKILEGKPLKLRSRDVRLPHSV